MFHEPLVLIPPMMCDARVFAPQINDLSNVGPVMYAPTSHSERMVDIATRILEWVPAEFALCGMGMGGTVALEIMRKSPERVRRLALISATHHGETPEAASAREPQIVAARSGRYDDVIKQEFDVSCLAAGPHRLSIGQLVTDMAHLMGPEAYVNQARAMQRRRDHQSTLRQITKPALIICGAEDTVIPVKRHEFMAEMIHNGQLEVVHGAGHLPTLEQPAQVSDLLYNWLSAPLILS